MTPFMTRVAEITGRADIGTDDLDSLAPLPVTRLSRRVDSGTGADRHVAIRSLAEQLICEANAVLAPASDHLTLTDELPTDELAFDMHYRGRHARVSTTFTDGTAYARLVGDGFDSEEPHELADAAALPELVIRLLAQARTLPHPA